MPKQISFLYWIEELLPEGVIQKPMFGGRGFYYDQKLILVIFENPGDRTYKNITAAFDIWNGCMFPSNFENHDEIKNLFPILINHPVLGKWLYLPQQTEDFEEIATQIIRQIPRRIHLFGTIPKPKKKSATKKVSKKTKKKS